MHEEPQRLLQLAAWTRDTDGLQSGTQPQKQLVSWQDIYALASRLVYLLGKAQK